MIEDIKTYRREYYNTHKEKYKEYRQKCELKRKGTRKEYVRQYKLNNRERIEKKNKEWRLKNKEKIKEISRANKKIYYLKNKEKINKRKKEYRKNNPMVSINSENKRRQKMRITDITTLFLKRLWNKTKNCELCGVPLQNHSHYPDGRNLDHIIPINIGGMHIKNNIRFICVSCNLQRPKDGSDNLQLIINYK